MDESHPQKPVNPYGASKMMVERMLPDYELVHGMQAVCLRYFNAAGADPDLDIGECHEPETHLIPVALLAAQRRIDCLDPTTRRPTAPASATTYTLRTWLAPTYWHLNTCKPADRAAAST